MVKIYYSLFFSLLVPYLAHSNEVCPEKISYNLSSAYQPKNKPYVLAFSSILNSQDTELVHLGGCHYTDRSESIYAIISEGRLVLPDRGSETESPKNLQNFFVSISFVKSEHKFYATYSRLMEAQGNDPVYPILNISVDNNEANFALEMWDYKYYCQGHGGRCGNIGIVYNPYVNNSGTFRYFRLGKWLSIN